MRPALLAVALGALGLVMLAIAGPLYQLGVLPLSWAYGLMRGGAYVGLATIGVALGAGGWAYRRQAWLAAAVSAAALIAGLAVVWIPLQWQRRMDSLPPIHDISTDLQNPPAFKAILAQRDASSNPLDRPPIVADQQRRAYPDVAPVTLPVPPDQAFEEALQTVQDAEWQIADADKQAGLIEATDSSPWFGFKDDIVVRLTPWGSGTRVDVRSASRVGTGDGGSNARRIMEFLGELEGK